MKGIPQHVFPTVFFLPSLRSCLLGLEPSQNPWCLASGANEAQALDVSLQKFTDRQSERQEVDLLGFREKHTQQGVGHCRGQELGPWNVVWLGFASWVNSYANEWEDHPNHWGTTHCSV